MSNVEGFETAAVTEWLRARVPALDPPLTPHLIQGGRSNLTYRVEDAAGRRWVLRRPPLHGVLESAHDMGREHRIIAALQGSAVPVPPLVGHEEDEAVTGAEFYVMEFVDGHVLRDPETATRCLDADRRRAAAESLVDVLVELHAVDPDAVGLGGLARKHDYVARQLRRWHGQLEKGAERDLPTLLEVHRRLAGRIPEQGAAAIVHGDYRLDNVIVGDGGDVRAVLDWELCTLGDPMADVGTLMVYWTQPGDETIPLIAAPTVADGFPTRDEVAARYAQRSGRDLSELDYYVAFGEWKLAVILEGVYTRFRAGAYGEVDASVWEPFGDIVLGLGDRALDRLERAGW